MVRYFIMIFILSSTFAYSQQVVISTNARDSDYKIYSSYYNYVHVCIVNRSCSNLLLKSNSFEIIKTNGIGDSCSFYIREKNIRPQSRIYVYDNDLLVDSIRFLINHDIPLPALERNGKRGEGGNSLSRSLDSIYCIPYYGDKYNSKLVFNIQSFIVEITKDDELYCMEYCTGNKFPQSIKEIFETLKPADKITIKSAVIKDDLGNIYTIPEKKFSLNLQ